MRRGLGLLLAGTVLLGAACGDDDDDVAVDEATTTAPDPTTTAGGSGDEPVTGPSDISAEDQSGDGTTVEVASVTLPTPGFIAVHADNGGQPGPVVGHSELLPEGESSDVVVELDEPLTEDGTLHPMVHVDANGNEEYDFDPPDVTDDVPGTFEDGGVAMVAIDYTVTGGTGGTGDGEEGEGAAGATSVTVRDFAFQPSSIEVPAGTTVTWTNEDTAPHTVTAGTPAETSDAFHESLPGGATAEITFDEPGTFAYFCAVHPGMTAEVVVS